MGRAMIRDFPKAYAYNKIKEYTVNGIRGSSNTVSLDGSALLDVGNNGGVIVSLWKTRARSSGLEAA